MKARKKAEEKYFGEFAYDYSQQMNMEKGEANDDKQIIRIDVSERQMGSTG